MRLQSRLLDSSETPFLSSRADKIGVAIHNSTPAESNQINNAHKVRNLESALLDLGGLGGGLSACLPSGKSTRLAQTQCARKKADKGGRFANSPPVPLEENLSQVTPESSEKVRKVESTFAKLDSSMDCRDFANAKSRNDSILDSINNARNDRTAQNLNKPAKDSKICDEKLGLCESPQGCAFSVRKRLECEAVADLSRKGQSPQVKVSIIVPVFNTQPYIARCLQSLITQSLQDIEIIIVDDCGSDGAMLIAKEFATRDCRIHIVHNPSNLGLLHTRCVGAAAARGEYILYVDSDDYIKPHLCELAYKRALESQADMVVFGSECQGFYRYIYQPRDSRVFVDSREVFFPTASKFSPYLWNKLYKRELIAKADSILWRIAGPITLAEDLLKAFVLLRLGASSATLPSTLYVYCANASSSTSISTRDRAERRAKALADIAAYSGVACALKLCASELGGFKACALYGKFDRLLRYLVLCKSAQAGRYVANMYASLFVWFRVESLCKIALYILSFGKVAR